jgi:hypothetical protein
MGISAKQYQTRLQPLLSIERLRQIAETEIKKEEQAIKGLKEQDFLEGDIYGDGTNVAYRSRNYSLFKSNKNPLAGGAVDLILTGAFVGAMRLNKQKQGKYTFGNSDSKRGALTKKYGNGIFGLNQAVFSKYQKDFLLSRFIKNIKTTQKIA